MHDNDIESMDSLFRDALQDAKIKAPRRAWRSISASLDAQGSSESRGGFLRFSVPVFAFAAAALAAVLFLTNTHSNTPYTRQSSSVALSDDCSSESLLSYAAGLSLVPASDLNSSERRPSSVQSVESVMPAGPSQGENTSIGQISQKKNPSETATQEHISDPFDEFTRDWSGKTEKGRRRVFIDVYGNAAGNDSRAAYSRPSYLNGYSGSDGVEEESVSTFGVPVSLGLSAKYYLNSQLSLGVGLEWSLLTRTFRGSYKTASGDFTHSLQYVGIPVSVSYDLVQGKTLKFYLSAGGNVQKAVSSKYYLYSESSSHLYSEDVANLQLGVFGGFGVEFSLTDRVSVYADPMLTWWIPSEQPKSIRTAKPVMVNFEAGLRFRL